MKFQGVSMAVCGILLSSAVFAAESADQHFIKKAIEGNLAEVRMGDLAQRRAASRDVKDFGTMLSKDHFAANTKAQDVAKSMGVHAPGEPGGDARGTYRELSALSSDRFDHQFLDSMVKDHQKDIAEYEKEAKGSSPAADYAKQILPDLRKHLEMAQQLEQKENAR